MLGRLCVSRTASLPRRAEHAPEAQVFTRRHTTDEQQTPQGCYSQALTCFWHAHCTGSSNQSATQLSRAAAPLLPAAPARGRGALGALLWAPLAPVLAALRRLLRPLPDATRRWLPHSSIKALPSWLSHTARPPTEGGRPEGEEGDVSRRVGEAGSEASSRTAHRRDCGWVGGWTGGRVFVQVDSQGAGAPHYPTLAAASGVQPTQGASSQASRSAPGAWLLRNMVEHARNGAPGQHAHSATRHGGCASPGTSRK